MIMFRCDDFIYIQMQKTACTHIAGLLAQLFEGELIGKHNSATSAQLKSTPRFIGSIRNPWDWYLSLWAFGVGGRGSLRRHLTGRNLAAALKGALKNPRTGYWQCVDALTRDVKTWRAVYNRSDDVASFRRWLALLHDRGNYGRLGEGDHAVNRHVGLMTYRYLRLFCRCDERAGRADFGDFERLRQFDKDACYIDYFIRQETLEADLCAAVENVRALTEAEKALIFNAGKTNASPRPLPVAAYYDRASVEIIKNRDRLIVEKFNYAPPGEFCG